METTTSSIQKISKKSWGADEDQHLLKLIEEHGLNGSWTIISGKMGNRSGKQCRERYHNHLKSGITKVPWTKDEDELLNHSQRVMGNQWAKIAKLLPGRSDNSVKNRWHIINRHNKDAHTTSPAMVSEAAPVSVKGNKKTRPTVPKLSLNNLQQHHATPMPTTAMMTELDDDADDDGFDDLMSHFYSHNSHTHEMTMSSRSSRNNSGRQGSSSLGSGRRDMNTTSSGSNEATVIASYTHTYLDRRITSRTRGVSEDNVDEELDLQSMQLGCLSFNNTLNSNISELTGQFCCEDFEDEVDVLANSARSDDAWIDQIGEIANGLAPRRPLMINGFTVSPREPEEFQCNSAVQRMAKNFSNAENLDLDRFSEPAVTFREEIEEFADNLYRAEQDSDFVSSTDASDKCFGDDEVDGEAELLTLDCFDDFAATAAPGCATASSNSILMMLFSPFQQQQQKGSVLERCKNHSRMTPRSPACPTQVKRQRPSMTPRSPYNV